MSPTQAFFGYPRPVTSVSATKVSPRLPATLIGVSLAETAESRRRQGGADRCRRAEHAPCRRVGGPTSESLAETAETPPTGAEKGRRRPMKWRHCSISRGEPALRPGLRVPTSLALAETAETPAGAVRCRWEGARAMPPSEVPDWRGTSGNCEKSSTTGPAEIAEIGFRRSGHAASVQAIFNALPACRSAASLPCCRGQAPLLESFRGYRKGALS
jgi:hypothetical protein